MKSSALVINGRFLTQPVTGVQRVGIEFCQALDHMLSEGEYPGLEVELAVPTRSRLVTELRLEHIPIKRVGRFKGHLWEQLDLPWAARKKALLALGNTAPLMTLVASPATTYVMVHDLSYKYYPDAYSRSFRALYGMLIPIVLSRATKVFTVSNSEREAIARAYPTLDSSRVLAVQNGTDVAPSTNVATLESRQRSCLYVGSLTKRKNAEGLIKIAISLARDHDTSFTFVGSNGPNFEDVLVTIPEELSHKIKFLGQVNDKSTLSSAYAAAAVFVFPSFYEASPLPPVEAMAHGCPVVAADIPSLRERCKDAAVFCDPSNPELVVKSIMNLLSSETVWAEAQERGLKVAASYSWLRQARSIMNAIWGA